MGSVNRHVSTGGAVIAGGTLLTRVLGFVREILTASFFGAGATLDAFVVAFSVPNLFRRVLGEEMFERAFMPRFKRLASEGRGGRARAFLVRVVLLTCAALVLVSAVVWVLLPLIVRALAPGMAAGPATEALRLARVILPFLFLIGLSSLLGAVLLFSGRKMLFAIAPMVTNVAVVVVLVLLHEQLSIMALVVAWLVGAAAALLVQLPAAVAVFRALPRPELDEPPPEVLSSLRESGHILGSAVVFKAVEVVDRVVASFIGAGAISALYLSFRVVHLPFSILSLALSRSIAPELSRLRGERDPEGFGRLLTFGLNANLLLLAPAVVFLMLFAEDTVRLFYGRGSFGDPAVARTSLAFLYYAPAIVPMGMIALVNRVYSALEDNRVPFMAACVGGGLNVVLDLLLYRTPLEQGGIALASSIGLAVQTAVMVLLLARFDVHLEWRELGLTVLRVLPASVALVVTALTVDLLLPTGGGFPIQALRYLTAGAAGVVAYAAVAVLLWPRRRPERLRVVLTGGGTGGHVYPALAIWSMLDRAGMVDDAMFLGIRGRAEEVIVRTRGLPLSFIHSAPYAGGSPVAKLRSLLSVARGTLESLATLVRYRPHLVVATGGYVSAPVIVAAFVLKPFLKLRIVVEEQNLVPGILNKVASLLADVVLVSFRESAYFIWSSRCVLAGYPVRREYLEPAGDRAELRRRLGLSEDAFVVLVSGGSMGARSVNRAVVEALPRLREIQGVQLVHAIGMFASDGYHAVDDTVAGLREVLGAELDPDTLTARAANGELYYRGFEYLHDIIDYQRAADLLVSRAGAGSLAEVMAVGRAAVLVPKRGLPGDHQELNAIGLAEKGAAEVLFERRDRSAGVDVVDAGELADLVADLAADPERRVRLEQSARSQFFAGTESRVVETVRALLEGGDLDLIHEIVEPPFVRFQRQFDSLVAHLDDTPPGGLYHRLYDLKVEEYLASPSFLTVNRGVKLIGALRRTDLYPWLVDHFDGFRGFIRRNALTAVRKAEAFAPEFAGLVVRGLEDDYFEARREAVALYNRFWAELNGRPEAGAIHVAILGRLGRRRESFEVRAEAIRASVRFLEPDGFFATTRPFLTARNVRLREALLDAVEFGVSAGLLEDRDRVRRFVKRMLITTSQFRPGFRVRERYVRVVRALEVER